MAIKHIVFDWDGTLADTYSVILGGYNKVCECLNLPHFSYDEIKKITSSKQNKDTMGYLYGEKKEQAHEIYTKYIKKHHIKNLKSMPNAKEVLEFCKANNIKIYLITNKRRMFIIDEIDKLNFTNFFDNVVAAGDFVEDKPHLIATSAVFSGDIPKADEIMVVGDGIADYNTARTYDKNGLKTKTVIYDPNEKYTGNKPDYIIKDLLDIIHIINQYK